MSYRALLFCPDERLARVVTQVFSDLDFAVELVNEPFGAVKKLMAQRYDAVVVDCENEPNATLLFKSARNSSSNQSSLALALVEGQAGVAKAYRIGANLVLTKPLNVEQAKGTLRVARGLLRKNSDAAPAAPKPASAPAPAAAAPARPAIQNVPVEPAPAFEVPDFSEEALPAMAASAEIEESPQPAPVPEIRANVIPEAVAPTPSAVAAPLFESPISSPAAAAHAKSSSMAAAAAAPAREVPAPVEKPASVSFAEHAEPAAPSFGAVDAEDSGGSGGSKKWVGIAAAVIVAAALGYFGWSKFSGSSAAAPAAVTQPAAQPPAISKPSAVPDALNTAPLSGSMHDSKPSPAATGSVPFTASEPEVTTRKTPIVVKSYTPGKNHAQSEESAPQVPNPLAMASPNDKKLSGLVSSVPSALPTASLSTVKISQGVSQGLLIKRVQPRYPQNALSMRIQGTVQMQATINKEGNISNLKLISGDPVLAKAATDAVHQWRYKPYYLNGEPVEIETQITINFKLPN